MEQTARHDSYAGFAATAIRRHLVLVISCALVGLGLAAAYAFTRPVSYTASATVLPSPAIGNPLGPDTSATNGTQLTVAMQTEAGLVDTPAVAALASKDLGTTVPHGADRVSATVPPNTQIIKITYASRTPAEAQAGAEAFAKAFLAYRQSVAQASQQRTLDSLLKESAVIAAELRNASKLADHSSNPRSFAAQRVQILSSRAETLNANISSTRAESTDPGVVVSAASRPAAPNGLKPIALSVVGLVLGFVVGLVLALRREWRRDVVDASIDDDVSGVPLLAQLPAEPAEPVLVAHTGTGPGQEAYRRLRASLVASAAPPRLVAVSSVVSRLPSSRVAANLAVALANAGFRAAVVVADPGDRESGRLLGTAPSPGLAEVLTGAAPLSDCRQLVHGVEYVGPGRDLAAARELIAGPALTRTLAELGLDADYVLVAAADATTADADAVALACHAAVLVVGDGVSTHAETSAAVDRLTRLQVSTIGAVSVPRRPERAAAPVRRQAAPVTVRPEPAAAQRHTAGTSGRRQPPGLGTDG